MKATQHDTGRLQFSRFCPRALKVLTTTWLVPVPGEPLAHTTAVRVDGTQSWAVGGGGGARNPSGAGSARTPLPIH